jgi:hypothetical protein
MYMYMNTYTIATFSFVTSLHSILYHCFCISFHSWFHSWTFLKKHNFADFNWAWQITVLNVLLQNIPASGQTLWCTLEKKGKAKKQGDVKIRLSFSSEKNSQVASQEHRHLLRLMLLHELENSKVCCLRIMFMFTYVFNISSHFCTP